MFVISGSAGGPTRTGQPGGVAQATLRTQPAGDEYLVWVGGLDHGFGGITGVSINPRNNPNANHVARTKFVTLGFWRACLNRHHAAVLPMNGEIDCSANSDDCRRNPPANVVTPPFPGSTRKIPTHMG